MKLYQFIVVVVVSCLLSSSAQALTPFGIPAATLKQGQFASGFSFAQSKMDVEVSALGFTAISKDNEVDTYMANLVFGAHENWEFQFDLGISNSEYEGESSTGDFAGGFGLKTTWVKDDKFKLGSVATVHWYDSSTSGYYFDGFYWNFWKEKDDWTEIQFAIGPSYDFGSVCLYGGPFLHILDGSGKYTENGFSFSGDFEQDDMFGGFIGVQFEPIENATMGLEYQTTGSANSISFSFLWKF